MTVPGKAFTAKHERIINAVLPRLFSAKALLVPQSIDDYKGRDALSRELRFGENSVVLLTDFGMAEFRRMVSVLDSGSIGDGLADYSDIHSACRKVIQNCLSDQVMPSDANELMGLVRNVLDQEIASRRFVVPVYGIELENSRAFEMAGMTVVNPNADFVAGFGVRHTEDHLARAMDAMNPYLWLSGCASGTPKVALATFRLRAQLAVGLLAVAAAALYENGATGFRIGIVMSPEEGHGRSVGLSWSERDLVLNTSVKFARGQRLKLDADLEERLQELHITAGARAVVEASEKTELEEALARAVYWFSDAHRDETPVMQLVKYWSCIETFFALDSERITRSVSVGLATVLVYGGYRFVQDTEYRSLRAKIARLYGLRSRAVHRGVHDHVTRAHTAQLSQWAAWMIVSLLALTQRGYSTLLQIKDQAERLDALHMS